MTASPDPNAIEPRGEASIPQYLNLNRLSVNQLPPHPDITNSHDNPRISLGQFLNNLIAEISRINLDENSISHGSWNPGPQNTCTFCLHHVVHTIRVTLIRFNCLRRR